MFFLHLLTHFTLYSAGTSRFLTAHRGFNVSGLGANARIVCPTSTCDWLNNDCKDEDVEGDTGDDDGSDGSHPFVSLEPDDSILGKSEQYNIWDKGVKVFQIQARPYPGSSKLYAGNFLPDSNDTFKMSAQWCDDPDVESGDQNNIPDDEKEKKFATEHFIERQYVAAFIQSLISGVFPGGAKSKYTGYGAQTLIDNWNGNCLAQAFTVPGSRKEFRVPNELVFECLGSTTRMGSLVLLEKALNLRKAKCFSRLEKKPSPISRKLFFEWLEDSYQNPSVDLHLPFQPIREILGAWSYLQQDTAVVALNSIQTCLDTTFTMLQTSCPAFRSTSQKAGIRDHWLEFDKAYWGSAVNVCKDRAEGFLEAILWDWTAENGSGNPEIDRHYPLVEETIHVLQENLHLIRRPNTPPS